MKNKPRYLAASLFVAVFLSQSVSFAAVKRIEAKGEVTSVDPVYSSVTIKHGAIKGFAGDGSTDFAVVSADLLKPIHKSDLVDFTLLEDKGDARIEKIVRTGQAVPEKEAGVGKVVQDVLVGTGEIAKGITSPIEPAHQVVSGAVGVTTDATGSLLENADTQVKKKF